MPSRLEGVGPAGRKEKKKKEKEKKRWEDGGGGARGGAKRSLFEWLVNRGVGV